MGIRSKVKSFYRKHQTGIKMALSAIGGATVTFGGILIYTKTKAKNAEKEIDEMPIAVPEGSDEDDWSWADRMLQTIVSYEKDAEEGGNHWFECECQRTRWDKVNALASEIQPGDNEYYVIEGTNPDCNGDYETWFVHHFQDDFPSYPPEVIEKRYKKE